MDKFYYYHIIVKYGNPTIDDYKKYKNHSILFRKSNLNLKMFPISNKRAIENGLLKKELSQKDRDFDCYAIKLGLNFKFLDFVSENIVLNRKEKIINNDNEYCWCRFNNNKCVNCKKMEEV